MQIWDANQLTQSEVNTINGDNKQLRINDRIRAKEVRLIDKDGEQVGVVPLDEAMTSASQVKLDLVEISPNASPPVCRIMDFGKYLFQQKKKKAESKKKQHIVQIKELKYRPGIEQGDYQVKMAKLIKFINAGDKVKITMRFRGREMAHHDLGEKLLRRIEHDVTEIATVEQKPKFEGRQVVMILAPKKK